MKKKEIIEKLFETTEATFYKWKKQNRPIIKLIETYFDNDDLTEFLTQGKIEKLEKIKIKNRDQKIEEHIFFNAAAKIHNIDYLPIFGGKKGFWLNGVVKAIQYQDTVSKKSLLSNIMKLPTKFFESENWKKLTRDWIIINLSEYEIELICKNKEEFIELIKS